MTLAMIERVPDSALEGVTVCVDTEKSAYLYTRHLRGQPVVRYAIPIERIRMAQTSVTEQNAIRLELRTFFMLNET